MKLLGGYRLVRKLGSGSRAEVWLGSDGSATAAIKVFREDADPRSIDSEIEALGRAAIPHIVRLEDLSSGAEGMPCLILQRLSTVSLNRILVERRPSLGESVTILAPLALAIAELHRRGIAHRSLSTSAVLFDNEGAPTICGFGGAQLFGAAPTDATTASMPPAALSQTSGVLDDVRGMTDLCHSVLGNDGNEVSRWLGAGEASPSSFFSELADRLFSLSRPEAVVLSAASHRKEQHGVSLRLDCVAADQTCETSPSASKGFDSELASGPTRNEETNLLALFHLPDSLLRMVHSLRLGSGGRGGIFGVRERIATILRPVRRPVWIVAGAVAIAVTTFAAFAPIASDTARDAAPHTDKATNLVISMDDDRANSSMETNPVVLGDDPVAAAEILLSNRAECITARSVLCLDRVDQQGSAAMDADSNLIRLHQQQGVADSSMDLVNEFAAGPSNGQRVELIERLGDTALLTLSNKASNQTAFSAMLLLVRSDQGWRIRDVEVSDVPAPS